MSSILGFAKVLVDDHCTRCRLTLAVDEVCWYGPDTCRAPNP